MTVLAMTSLLTGAAPAVVLEKREEFLDLRWHRLLIVLGLRSVEYRHGLGQLCPHQSLCGMALAFTDARRAMDAGA